MKELNQRWVGSEVGVCVWNESQILWLEGSHVSSYLFERKAFALMVKESADRVQHFIDTHPEQSEGKK